MSDGTIMCLDYELDQAIRRFVGCVGPVRQEVLVCALNEAADRREAELAADADNMRQVTM